MLPSSPWRAGRQPVAIDAALVRVVDGNTPVWLANRAERFASSVRNGASRGVIRSGRRLSQMTMTARFMAVLLVADSIHSRGHNRSR
jgi:hypothetical protein